MNRATVLTALAAVLALAGCQDPYASNGTPRATVTGARRSPTTSDAERAGPRVAPASTSAQHAASSARRVARSFARGWVNWDWQTAARQQRALARLAIGSLAVQLTANAASARVDATLARDRPGSRGAVVAIALHAQGARAEGIVVTHEQATTDGRAGLGGPRYRVYLVHLRHDRHRWEVTQWAPQP